MAKFSIAKTLLSLNDLNERTKIADRLIFQKNSDTRGTAYFEFEYDGEINRLQIVSLNSIYFSKINFIENILTIQTFGKNNVINLIDVVDDSISDPIPVNDILIGTLITDGENIGIIKDVINENVNVIIIYKPKPINWNDYS